MRRKSKGSPDPRIITPLKAQMRACKRDITPMFANRCRIILFFCNKNSNSLIRCRKRLTKRYISFNILVSISFRKLPGKIYAACIRAPDNFS